MRTIHSEVAVGAPAARVWAILADFDGWAQWNPFARVKGRLGIGERLEVEISLPDKPPMTFRPRIVTLEPGRELRWLGTLGMRGVFDGEHGFRVVPGDASRCRFEQFESFRGLLVAPILWKIEATTRTGFRVMNRALKAKAETG